MSGKHRARHDTIHILRTSIITKADDIRRPLSAAYRVIYKPNYQDIYDFYRTLNSSSPSSRSSPDLPKEDSEAFSRPTDLPPSESKMICSLFFIRGDIEYPLSVNSIKIVCTTSDKIPENIVTLTI